MRQHLKTTIKHFAMLFMLFAIVMPSFAQQPTLDKTPEGYYRITSDEDYETFIQIVATGNPYANAVLENDIKVCRSIGDGEERFHYRGTFDGQGHTITLTGEDNGSWMSYSATGVFAFTKPGCVIRNLILTGYLYLPRKYSRVYTGALVNDATGTIIENCYSEVVMEKEYPEPYMGGFVGVSRGKCFIENCAFAGSMCQSSTVSGFVAHNEHNLSIISSYSAPIGVNLKDNDGDATFFTDKMGEGDVCLNCYCSAGWNSGVKNNIPSCIELDLNNGNGEDIQKIGYLLNKGSKKGIVWYYHNYRPEPFKRQGSQFFISRDDGTTISTSRDCSHSYSNHICSYCGDIEPGSEIEPLQNRDGWTIDGIEYLIGKEMESFGPQVAYVCGFATEEAKNSVKAVHIPETVTRLGVDGKLYEYPVRHINKSAFAGTSIEYIYIPKTVNIVEGGFEGCEKLKYVHIADGGEKIGFFSTFAACPLEMVYIGRDVAIAQDGPFLNNNKIKYLFWGPRTTKVGNADSHYEGKGLTYKFCGGNAECNVIFLGDELSGNLNIDSNGDLSKIKHYYVNRNITGNCHNAENTGLFDACETVEFGPFVTTIAENSFESQSVGKPLTAVDFNHAYNLETIGDCAFRGCDKWNGALDFSTMKVKNLGRFAFSESGVKSVVFNEEMQTISESLFNGCKNLRELRIPSSITSIGSQAFFSCPNLQSVYFEESDLPLTLKELQFAATAFNRVYLGRNIITDDIITNSFFTQYGSIVTIGPKVTNLSSALFRTELYDAFTFEYSPEPLHVDGVFPGGATNLIIDREIVVDVTSDMHPIMIPFSLRGRTRSVLLGGNITKISDAEFEGFTNITHIVIPANIAEIGQSAFKDCKALQVASILGEPDIKESAFNGCENLKYLYFMGNSVQLAKNVFMGCPITEVTINFDTDPGAGSTEEAFRPITYNDAKLINAKNIELVSVPWVKFNSVRPNDTNISEDAAGGENFDRASIHHKFPVGEFDMVYLPFDMDSYYFGVDAEIYRLDITDEDVGNYHHNINTPEDRAYVFTTNEINFVKVDIDNEKRLTKGNIYFIKVKHEEETMAAYFSFFESNGINVVNKKTLLPIDLPSVARFKADEWDPTQDFTNSEDYNYYTFSEGVLKRINGEYHPARGTALLMGGKKNTEKAFCLNNGDETITSSVSNVAFSEKLDGYSSFYAADHNYIAPDWIDVYIVTSVDGTSINLEQVEDRTITKGQAVLLKSGNDVKVEGGITEYLIYATHGSSASYDSNLLKGVDEDTPADELSTEGFVYVLSCSQTGNNTGFYKLSGDRIMPTGKAYLDPSGLDTEQLAKACLFVCNDFITGVKSAPTIEGEQKIYDLMGRRLKEAGFKGIYIVNGKKVIVK